MTGLFTKIAAAITALTLLGTNPGTALDNLNGLVQQPGDTAFADREELTAPVDPIALCQSITIGWNLGNSLDATGNGYNSETSWGNPVVTKELSTRCVKRASTPYVSRPPGSTTPIPT